MQKLAIGLLLSLSATTAATAQETISITGHVTGDSKGYNKVYIYGTKITSDSTVITNGDFSFTVPYVKGIVPVLYTEYDIKVTKGVSPFSAIIDGPGKLTLNNVDITKGLSSGTWSGHPTTETYQSYSKGLSEVNAGIRKTLQEKYPGKDYKDSAYRAESGELTKKRVGAYLINFIKANPDSYASVVALRGQRAWIADQDVQTAYDALSAKQKASESAKDVADYLAGLKSSTVGSKVKDFTLLTPEEKNFTFSSLKGKYVIIDFWASWCGPCKASFPHMKEVYAKYKSDKFEIYSISIDKDKDAWLKELKVQELPWLHTLDTKNINQSSFAVVGVPTTYLIDPNGKIMMKEVGFDPKGGAMEKKLDELLGKK